MKIQQILKDSNYKLSQFSQEAIQTLENQVLVSQDKKGKDVYKIRCLVRNKEIVLTPEEVVRQLFLLKLIHEYQYSTKFIDVEYPVTFGKETKKADIVIREKDRPTVVYIVVELKRPKFTEGKKQLESYCKATGAPIGVWTNGSDIEYYHNYRKDPDNANFFEPIPNIPKATEKLSSILSQDFTLEDLERENDKHKRNSERTLTDLIMEIEEVLMAREGSDVFEEVFKLLFAKMYDEAMAGKEPKRNLHFRNKGETQSELKEKIDKLFENALKEWNKVFDDNDKIKIPPRSLSLCVARLENRKLLNSNLDLVDNAFEHLLRRSQKGDKGQYFTPRYVIDMCVKMMNPKKDEFVIDTAAGSSGFTVHSIFHVWEQILEEKGIKASHLFSIKRKPQECYDYVRDKVFAIDYDPKAVKVARCLNIIAGDGQTNVIELNTLDFTNWKEKIKDEDWIDTYNEGWKKLKKLSQEKDNYKFFNFDVLMANPPFAGDIDEQSILTHYELGMKENGKFETKVSREVLFLERNLNFLAEGGRMAVVLPQGIFNNSSDIRVRKFIAERCRILAVVGLHGNTFKPHTGTKTSVLFVQKWTDQNGINPRKDDYPIFFATQQLPSKDNSGEKIFLKDEKGEFVLDAHGHPIVQHDLFAVPKEDGTFTQDGITEAFIEFAKKEQLSFF